MSKDSSDWEVRVKRANGLLKLEDEGLVIIDQGIPNGQEWPWIDNSKDVEVRPDIMFCCFPYSSRKVGKRVLIPFYEILWASTEDNAISVSYAKRKSKNSIQSITQTFPLDNPSSKEQVDNWLERLLDLAYGKSQRCKRIKVLINPFGGQGKAEKLYFSHANAIFEAAKCEVDIQLTKRQGHALEIAEQLDISKFDVVACCSGDGVPYEVFNGFGKRPDAKRALSTVALAQIPGGSGNAMSWNLNGTDSPGLAALAIVKGLRMPLDLVSITQGDSRTLSFLSQSVGIIAESDLATENLRWMGDSRFTIGFLVRLLGKTTWPVDVAICTEIDDRDEVKRAYHAARSDSQTTMDTEDTPVSNDDDDDDDDNNNNNNNNTMGGLPSLRYGTINDPLPPNWELKPYPNLGNFYAGNMAIMSANSNVFPAALPSDGRMDLICIDGDIPSSRALQLSGVVETGGLIDHPTVRYRKVSGYRIVPRQKEGYISIDGERVPFEGFQAEVHQNLGCVLSKSGKWYEAKGPSLPEGKGQAGSVPS